MNLDITFEEESKIDVGDAVMIDSNKEDDIVPGSHPIPIVISGLGDDSFACMARRNIEIFRVKFDKLLQSKWENIKKTMIN